METEGESTFLSMFDPPAPSTLSTPSTLSVPPALLQKLKSFRGYCYGGLSWSVKCKDYPKEVSPLTIISIYISGDELSPVLRFELSEDPLISYIRFIHTSHVKELLIDRSESYSGDFDLVMNMLNAWMLALNIRNICLQDCSEVNIGKPPDQNVYVNLRLFRFITGKDPLYRKYGYLGTYDEDKIFPKIPLKDIRELFECLDCSDLIKNLTEAPESTLGEYASKLIKTYPIMYQKFSHYLLPLCQTSPKDTIFYKLYKTCSDSKCIASLLPTPKEKLPFPALGSL